MAVASASLADYMEAIARSSKAEPPAGYGYKAELELGVGFFVSEVNQCKCLEKPIVIPNGTSNFQGYRVFFAYCSKDGVESMLMGQCPPVLPATTLEPKEFPSLAAISNNFGAKDPEGSAKAGGSDYCVALRVPAEIANQVETPGRELWMVQFNMDKVSPFLQAAKEGNAADVAKGLGAGIAGNTCDENGVTALMMAIMGGSVETAQLLMDKGAELDTAEPISGRTPLMFAAQGSAPQLVEILLSKKADPAKADKEGQTPLMWAAVAGRLDAAKMLAAAGGKATTNKEGQTAAAIAEKMGHAEVAAACK